MRYPLINIPVIYHLGTLNPAHRGAQYPTSFEGAWLSASLCPEAWCEIAKLGGQPWQELTRHDAFFLDAHALTADCMSSIMEWAESVNLIEKTRVYEVSYLDCETGDRRTIYEATKERAKAEFEDLEVLDSNPSMKENKGFFVLTPEGRRRAIQHETLQPAGEFAVQFWVEDVLREKMPQVVGIYHNEIYDPLNYSAPRASILPSALNTFDRQVTLACRVDEDEDLLDTLSDTHWIEPEDFETPYCFITDCVSADGDEIGTMVDSAARKDITYLQLLRRLNAGTPGAGKSQLDEIFPCYDRDLRMKDDWSVSYHASSYQGLPCLYVRHSAIEYVFQQEGLVRAPFESESEREASKIARPRPAA